MGIFNWVSKGVKVEKRKPKTKSSEAVMDLQQLSPDFGAPQPFTPPDYGTSAASILFENTERQTSQPYTYDPNTPNSFGQFSTAQYPATNVFGAPQNGYGSTNAFGSSALGGSTYGNRNILVITPSSNAEVTEVVTNLRNGDACIICLEGLDVTDAQRRLDFLSGVISAMNGSIKRLNANTYILTPTGIGVKRQSQ